MTAPRQWYYMVDRSGVGFRKALPADMALLLAFKQLIQISARTEPARGTLAPWRTPIVAIDEAATDAAFCL
jgi:hypothetical protein